MPRVSQRSRASAAGSASNTAERTLSSRRRRKRRRWLRICRLLAKRKWRGIGAMGVMTILLAALLLCLTAYFEKWGQELSTSSSLDNSAPAPTTEDPSYFEDKEIPQVFARYASLHNSATTSPKDVKCVVYEIPGNTTLENSLLGLTSSYLFALMSERILLVQWTADFESPASDDVDTENGTTRSQGNSDRTSSLEEVFLDPGFFWSWERFEDRWINYFGYAEEELVLTHVDVMENYDTLVCGNLKSNFMGDKQFIKIVSSEYFAPLLTVNQYASKHVLEEVQSVDTFASLSNWLLRPVPTVTDNLRRFKERYFEDNYVIVLEINVLPDSSDESTMSVAQQQLFLKEAGDASNRAKSNRSADQQGIVVLVVTDDEALLTSRLQDAEQDSWGAGVVAIAGPRGYGTTRILSELRQAWLLGYGDVSIVSPASAKGVFGHARTSLSPIVILDGTTAHQSTSSQPCLASVGLVQEATCFSEGMLSRLNYDPNVPCLGTPPSTVASADASRGDVRRREL